ncbi:DUF7530 family protein [Salinibaculum rarum]|uniref:DUF7530 family protein n=1 Tax=Salinibaculum rarum TaxID=3058903 RepID=UPI00265E1DA3|nr:hypothetical protein [Salinibaculum sp. KK48]
MASREHDQQSHTDEEHPAEPESGPAPPKYGETWVYESIIGALPGIHISPAVALAIQFVGFEVAILLLAWYYQLWTAAIAGTIAVAIATVGSAEMLRIARVTRGEDVPDAYRRLLFSSNVEVVLAVLAYIALVTHLFVWDPRTATEPLVTRLFGADPPILVVYLMLLILWDVCYRIGTGWWASITALWRSARFRFDAETKRSLRRADLEALGFGLLQFAFVPFLLDQPVLLAAVVGHVLAVTAVTGLAIVLLGVRSEN